MSYKVPIACTYQPYSRTRARKRLESFCGEYIQLATVAGISQDLESSPDACHLAAVSFRITLDTDAVSFSRHCSRAFAALGLVTMQGAYHTEQDRMSSIRELSGRLESIWLVTGLGSQLASCRKRETSIRDSFYDPPIDDLVVVTEVLNSRSTITAFGGCNIEGRSYFAARMSIFAGRLRVHQMLSCRIISGHTHGELHEVRDWPRYPISRSIDSLLVQLA